MMSMSVADGVFAALFRENSNSAIYKQAIKKVTTKIEERTYYYFTAQDAQFLSKVCDQKMNRQIFKNRIRQITDEKLNQVFDEIISGHIQRGYEEEDDHLQVQLDIQQAYQRIPEDADFYKSQVGELKIKKINEDFKQFKQRMDEIRRVQQMKKAEKLALQQQFKRSLEKQKRQQHRQQIKRNIEELKAKQKERQQASQKFKSFLKQFKKAKPLHVLMQEEYRQKVQLPALQQSRRKLQTLTHRKKPTLQQINDHDRMYIQSKSNRPEPTIRSQTVDVSFKSHFYQAEQQRLKQRQQYQQNGPQWDQIQKKKRYSQFVKDKIRPKVSQRLKAALQESQSRAHVSIDVPDRSKIIEVGKNYLQFMRGLQKKRLASPAKTPVTSLKQSRYINYLEELKAHSQHAHTSLDWQKDLKERGASKMQKRERVLMKSKQLEQKAFRDEKYVQNCSYGRAEEIINKKKQIDDTLLSSIKAKVAILRDANLPD